MKEKNITVSVKRTVTPEGIEKSLIQYRNEVEHPYDIYFDPETGTIDGYLDMEIFASILNEVIAK